MIAMDSNDVIAAGTYLNGMTVMNVAAEITALLMIALICSSFTALIARLIRWSANGR
jgi:hypothetical protein